MATSKISLGNVYRNGDTFSVQANYCGYISSGTTSCGFLVIFDKPLSPDITTLTINTLVGGIRGTLGYVDGTSNNTNLLANYTCSLTKIANNMARLVISKGSVMSNATNNTPVNLYGGTLTVTFS